MEALTLLVENNDLVGVDEPIMYLVNQLRQHIGEERRLFDKLFVAAGGSET